MPSIEQPECFGHQPGFVAIVDIIFAFFFSVFFFFRLQHLLFWKFSLILFYKFPDFNVPKLCLVRIVISLTILPVGLCCTLTFYCLSLIPPQLQFFNMLWNNWIFKYIINIILKPIIKIQQGRWHSWPPCDWFHSPNLFLFPWNTKVDH
jgi:hypothetical protein